MADMYKIVIVNRQNVFKIPTGFRLAVRRACNAVLRMENFKGSAELSVTIVDNGYMTGLYRQYFGRDTTTDVIAFPMGENDNYDVNKETGAKILGDIVVSIEKAAEQASLYGRSLQMEVVSLVVHGALHLLGYDHELSSIEQARMREREMQVMDMVSAQI
ncbi:MAG: rRNA maturation RNase YbeY [Oscillospiraceae bacterium]|jgi:probable rRNA maturation factor|nr:rRNA maturation RNase YbeY [Oscillospiraceae bacterium]